MLGIPEPAASSRSGGSGVKMRYSEKGIELARDQQIWAIYLGKT